MVVFFISYTEYSGDKLKNPLLLFNVNIDLNNKNMVEQDTALSCLVSKLNFMKYYKFQILTFLKS